MFHLFYKMLKFRLFLNRVEKWVSVPSHSYAFLSITSTHSTITTYSAIRLYKCIINCVLDCVLVYRCGLLFWFAGVVKWWFTLKNIALYGINRGFYCARNGKRKNIWVCGGYTKHYSVDKNKLRTRDKHRNNTISFHNLSIHGKVQRFWI